MKLIGSKAKRGLKCGCGARRRTALLAAVGMNLGFGVLTHAASLVWDASGSSSGTGGSGNWNLTGPLWTSNGTTFSDWTNGSVAVFNSSAGTVTTTSAVTAGGLTFNAPYTLTGSSVLTLNGSSIVINTGGFNVLESLSANTLALASGSTTINKTGVGILTLVNDQSSSIPANSTWNISGGTLNASTGIYSSGVALGDGKELGSSSGFTLILNGGSLSFTASGGAGLYTARTVNVSATGGSISDGGFAPGEAAGGSTISPVINIAAGNGLNLVANDILEFDNNDGAAGVISGAGGITTCGTGTAEILSTNNTYAGGTTISAGSTLMIGAAGSLGTGTGNLNVAGTLNLNGVTLPVKNFNSAGGTFDFNISSGGVTNKITAASAVMTGTTNIVLGIPTGTIVSGGNMYTLVTSTAGGMSGSVVAAFNLAGGENLTIPVNGVMENISGTEYRLSATAAATGSSITLTTAVTIPARTVAIMPLGSSITAGYSAQSPYDGGGYMSQLYQHLVNDGRFNPNFVGSSTVNEAVNPTGPALTTTVGQTKNEGHSGYTTTQTLANLNGNDNSGGNDGGYWLQVGNGVNPNIITLNIGGNDYVANPNDTTVITRLDQILTEIYALRPTATIFVSNILYRGDGTPAGIASHGATGTTGFENLYNPLIPGLVYQHVLMGQHVAFVDMYDVVTPNESLALIGPDLVHPTQAGYDLMGDTWYTAITTGQAFYTGNAGTSWNANGSGGTTSWDMDFQRTTDAGVAPGAGTDVYFNGVGGTTTLGADAVVRSVNFAANYSGGTTPAVTVAGPNILTIGAGGITVQAGSGTNLIAAPVVLGSAQTWSNVSTNPFTVSGNVSGGGMLNIGGTGVIVLSGNNGFTNQTNVSSGTLNLSNTNALQNSTLNLSTGSVVFDQSVAGKAFAIGGLAGITPIVLNNNASIPAGIALTVGGNNQNTTYAGQFGGLGSLIKVGIGTLTLTSGGTGITGNYNYSGGLTIDGGTVSTVTIAALGVGGNGGYPSVATVTLNGGELDFTNTANPLVSTVTMSLGSGNGSIGILLSSTTWNVSAGVTGPGMLAKNGAGILWLNGRANNYSGGTTVTAGTLTAGTPGSLGSGGVMLANSAVLSLGLNATVVPNTGVIVPNSVGISPAATATLQLAPNARFSSGGVGPVTIGSGGVAIVSIGQTPATGVTNGALKTASITFSNSSSGTLDLGRNDLDVTGQSLLSVDNLVKSAYSNGTWAGPGITSTAAATDTTHLTALAVIANNNGGPNPLYGTGGTLGSSFDGIQPGATDILVKYTYYGDTNLDGKIDGGDYSRIDAAYGTSLTGWYNGDFNYDGIIDGSDYTLIDNAYNTQGATISTAISGLEAQVTAQIAQTSAVPEPASLVMLALGGLCLLGRRKRKDFVKNFNFDGVSCG